MVYWALRNHWIKEVTQSNLHFRQTILKEANKFYLSRPKLEGKTSWETLEANSSQITPSSAGDQRTCSHAYITHMLYHLSHILGPKLYFTLITELYAILAFANLGVWEGLCGMAHRRGIKLEPLRWWKLWGNKFQCSWFLLNKAVLY